MKTSSLKPLQLVSLFAACILLLSQCHRVDAADDSKYVIVLVFITPEFQSVDANVDGVVTFDECLSATKQLFPQESAADQNLIAHGCMKLLGAQQQSQAAVLTEIDVDVPAPPPTESLPSTDGTAPPPPITPIVAAQTFSDRLREHMSLLKKGAKAAREEYAPPYCPRGHLF
jgi:hypothetical protein